MKTPNRYEPHGLFNTPESVETALSNAEHLIGGLSPNERIVGYTIMYTVYNAFAKEFNTLVEQLDERTSLKNLNSPNLKYLLNGEPVELRAFIEANREAFSIKEIEEILVLLPGESLTFGMLSARNILTRIA